MSISIELKDNQLIAVNTDIQNTLFNDELVLRVTKANKIMEFD